MSNFAFGTYRITDQNPQHVQALREAIDAGITMIDTSSNYMDGSAEIAIALAFREFDDTTKAKVEIVSKYGYIQGTNMHSHKEEAYEGVVEFNEQCFHSIAPSFMQDQLSKSLLRLERDKIDCYLIHNPEYFILDALNKNADKDSTLDAMYARIYEAFIEGSSVDALNKFATEKKIEGVNDFCATIQGYEDVQPIGANYVTSVAAHRDSFIEQLRNEQE